MNTSISNKRDEPFRVALSLSPFSLEQFKQGYTFQVDGETASTPQELQKIYCDRGATEMFVRIATKRFDAVRDDMSEEEPDNNSTLEHSLALCRIAAELGVPINPEIMCAYTYMDMSTQQAPNFEEYPEIFALQRGKAWEELDLDEICTVLKAYGQFVAESILQTGCTVSNWNLSNEANYGFAGISYGLKTAVNPKLVKMPKSLRYMLGTLSVGWFERNIWCYDAKAFAATREGILAAYEKMGIDASDVRFSTHIATVIATPRTCAAYFSCLKENGYALDTAGISYYPSAPSMCRDKEKLLKETVTAIYEQCRLPVFIAEYAYPSGPMEGPFASWIQKTGDYEHDQHGQASLYADVIAWGKTHHVAGIRYWAPDFKGWYAMAMFEFEGNRGIAKTILKKHKEIADSFSYVSLHQNASPVWERR